MLCEIALQVMKSDSKVVLLAVAEFRPRLLYQVIR
jgi:hypothetical protein